MIGKCRIPQTSVQHVSHSESSQANVCLGGSTYLCDPKAAQPPRSRVYKHATSTKLKLKPLKIAGACKPGGLNMFNDVPRLRAWVRICPTTAQLRLQGIRAITVNPPAWKTIESDVANHAPACQSFQNRALSQVWASPISRSLRGHGGQTGSLGVETPGSSTRRS